MKYIPQKEAIACLGFLALGFFLFHLSQSNGSAVVNAEEANAIRGGQAPECLNWAIAVCSRPGYESACNFYPGKRWISTSANCQKAYATTWCCSTSCDYVMTTPATCVVLAENTESPSGPTAILEGSRPLANISISNLGLASPSSIFH
jgi:hypothetical protein